MTHYGLFLGGGLPLDDAVDSKPHTLIIADTEPEVWQHIFDKTAAHLKAAADNVCHPLATVCQQLLAEQPPSDTVRADLVAIGQWLQRVEDHTEVRHVMFAPLQIARLTQHASAPGNGWIRCTDMYYADLRYKDPWAFVFRGDRGGEVIVYTHSPDAYNVGTRYIITAPQTDPSQSAG